ncbi:hypothetical protein [uncultured Imperialibacter sp.]|uniref:hypothetical protein n=1 Tax=uncultured Imperialibacter sp. TaxID=1672639 RepID=UPI0030DD157E|tara:strand:+ start:22192 stop:22383 length:192 start_codon:yes stop_codon:yes gene_type:complete
MKTNVVILIDVSNIIESLVKKLVKKLHRWCRDQKEVTRSACLAAHIALIAPVIKGVTLAEWLE